MKSAKSVWKWILKMPLCEGWGVSFFFNDYVPLINRLKNKHHQIRPTFDRSILNMCKIEAFLVYFLIKSSSVTLIRFGNYPYCFVSTTPLEYERLTIGYYGTMD